MSWRLLAGWVKRLVGGGLAGGSACPTVSAVLILSAGTCLGQAGRAELFGAIQDPAGLAVAQAKVEAEDQATMARYSALSDERGDFPFAKREFCKTPKGARRRNSIFMTPLLAELVQQTRRQRSADPKFTLPDGNHHPREQLGIDVASAASTHAAPEQRELCFVGNAAAQGNDLGRGIPFSQRCDGRAVHTGQVHIQ